MPILAVDPVVAAIRACSVSSRRLVVAVDGHSGSGKSTLAEAVAEVIGAVIVPCDDFFAASVSDADWDRRTPEQRAADAMHCRRPRREAIEPLRAGRSARWYAFDFLAGLRANGTYSLQETPTERSPKPVVLLDGAYSARPELASVLDLSVLVEPTPATRQARLEAREAPAVLRQWHAAGIRPRSTTSGKCVRARPSTRSCKRMGLLANPRLQRRTRVSHWGGSLMGVSPGPPLQFHRRLALSRRSSGGGSKPNHAWARKGDGWLGCKVRRS